MNKKQLINIIPYLLIFVILGTLLFSNLASNIKEFTMNDFMNRADDMEFVDATIDMKYTVINVNGTYKEDGKNVPFEVTLPNTQDNVNFLRDVLDTGKDDTLSKIEAKDGTQQPIWLTLLLNWAPLVILVIGIYYLTTKINISGGNNKAFDFTKSRARIEGDVKTRFDDVAGCEEEKEEVKEIIDYLKEPKRFTEMGAHIPHGILMVGPPGTGKTLLAKAVAGEADVPFFSISGSDFVEMFVGTGASRVRDMFKKAKQASPCILFIDEIDAVGRQRGAGMGGGNDEREQTLNQLLVEMDGMDDNSGVIVIAATNRVDVLDPALLRSGRFDRTIRVNLPDRKGRYEILEVHAKNKKLANNASLKDIAQRTPGFSGADLANLLNEAAILSVRENRKEISMDDLDEAIDRVMMGPAKKSRKYTEEEKRRVAFHEAGHAVIGIKLEDANMVQKITIIPRGDAGGYNLMTPRDEKFIPTKTDLMAQITGYLGGRVSEEVVFNEISAGASSDIQQASKIARKMVRQWGMSSLGPIEYDDGSDNVFLGRDYGSAGRYSGEIAYEIDKEVRKIINECYEQAKKMIIKNRDLLNKIAEALIENETITAEQIRSLEKYGTLEEPKVDQEEKPKTVRKPRAKKEVSEEKVVKKTATKKEATKETPKKETTKKIAPKKTTKKEEK